MRVLSHGGGVQTRALLHASLAGVFPRPDFVVFADTGAEPRAIYEALEHDRAVCAAEGLGLEVVSNGVLSAVDQWGGVPIPAFTLNDQGKKGMLHRQCTTRFKRTPIKALLRKLGATRKNPAELWLGISTDEAHRAKPSDVQYVKHSWPLLEAGWSRENCLEFLRDRGIIPTKSACVFCPYRSQAEWEQVRRVPEDFNAAIQYDDAIRDKRPKGGQLFVHRSCLPLGDAPIEDTSLQNDLWGNECEGYCGL